MNRWASVRGRDGSVMMFAARDDAGAYGFASSLMRVRAWRNRQTRQI